MLFSKSCAICPLIRYIVVFGNLSKELISLSSVEIIDDELLSKDALNHCSFSYRSLLTSALVLIQLKDINFPEAMMYGLENWIRTRFDADYVRANRVFACGLGGDYALGTNLNHRY